MRKKQLAFGCICPKNTDMMSFTWVLAIFFLLYLEVLLPVVLGLTSMVRCLLTSKH